MPDGPVGTVEPWFLTVPVTVTGPRNYESGFRASVRCLELEIRAQV
jgi:hypothetical protein